MSGTFAGVPVNLSAVESTTRTIETETEWSVPFPGRTIIHQLFVSLSLDQGGFKVAMPPTIRQQALTRAHDELGPFLREVVKKSKAMAVLSGYKGTEVGFPVVVHELDAWAMRICNCWPH
jgi:hypothetical protein